MSHQYHFDLSHFSIECFYDSKEEQLQAAVDSSYSIVIRGGNIRQSQTRWVLPAILGKNGERVTEETPEEGRILTAELLEDPQLFSCADGRSPMSRFVTKFTWSAAFNVLSVRRNVRINAQSAADSDPFADNPNASPILGGHHARSSSSFGMPSPQASGHYRQVSYNGSDLPTPRTNEALSQSLQQVSLGRQSVVVGDATSGLPATGGNQPYTIKVLVMEKTGYDGSVRNVGEMVYGILGANIHVSQTVVDLTDRSNCVFGGQWYEMHMCRGTSSAPSKNKAAPMDGVAGTPKDADVTSSVGTGAEDLEESSNYVVTTMDGDGSIPTMKVRFLINASVMEGCLDVTSRSPSRRRLEISRFKNDTPFPYVFVIDQVSISNARQDAYNVAVKLHKALDSFTISTHNDQLYITKPQDSKQRSAEEKLAAELHNAFESYVADLPGGAGDHFRATVPFQNPVMRGGGSGSSKGHLLQLHEMYARSDTDDKGDALPVKFNDPSSRIVVSGTQGSAHIVAVGDLFSRGPGNAFEEVNNVDEERPSPDDPLEKADEIRENIIARAAASDAAIAPGRDPITEVLLRRLVKVNLRADPGDALNRVFPKRSRQATLDVLVGTPFQPNFYEHNNGSNISKVASIDLIPLTRVDSLPPDGVRLSLVIGTARQSVVRGQSFTVGGEVVTLRVRRFLLPDVAAMLVHSGGRIEKGCESSIDVSKRVLGGNVGLTLEALMDYDGAQ